MAYLTDILIVRGVLPIEHLDNLPADEDDGPIIRALVAQGIVTERQFASALAEKLNLPFVELVEYPVDRMAISVVPASVCRRYSVLPVAIEDGRMLLAMIDPGNVVALDDVRAAARMTVTPVVAERGDLLAAIERYYRADGELSDLTSTLEEESGSDDNDGLGEAVDDDVPIVRFVNLIVSQAIQDRASDIHIEPAERDLRVRYRIDGVLHEMQRAPKSIQSGVISRLKIMSDIDIAERRKPQDGRMSVLHAGRKIDLRVATLPTVWGEKIVLRILDNAESDMKLSDLGLLERNAEAYRSSYTGSV